MKTLLPKGYLGRGEGPCISLVLQLGLMETPYTKVASGIWGHLSGWRPHPVSFHSHHLTSQPAVTGTLPDLPSCLCQHGPCMASLSTSSTCALSMANKLPFSASSPNTPSTFCLGRNLAVPWEARSPSGHVKKAAQALIPPRPREEVCFWLHCSRF